MPALSTLRFATFRVPNQVFYQSALSAGIVNLKPLVPGRASLSSPPPSPPPRADQVGARFIVAQADSSCSYNADVLVIPRRVAPRFRDLTADEVTDLFQSVHQISRVIEREYKAQCVPLACLLAILFIN